MATQAFRFDLYSSSGTEDSPWALYVPAAAEPALERRASESQGRLDDYEPVNAGQIRDCHALVDDPDENFALIARRVRAGDGHLTSQLEALARGSLPGFDEDARNLGLEVLSAARSVDLQPMVLGAILLALMEPSASLRFGAIAAAANLSKPARHEVLPVIGRLAEMDPDADVRSAAEAFLRRHG